MNWWNRSLASLGYRWKKNMLLFLVIVTAATLLLPAWSMKQTARTALIRAQEEMPAYVNMMVSGGDWYSVDEENYFSPELAQKAAALPQVKDVDHMSAVNVYSRRVRGLNLYGGNYTEIDGQWVEIKRDEWKEPIWDNEWQEYLPGWIQVVGVSNLADYWDFRKEKTAVTEGRTITKEDAGGYVMVMPNKIASDNQLQIGEKAVFQSYFDHDVEIELELVGLHNGIEDAHQGRYGSAGSSSNTIYIPIEAALQFYPGVMESRFLLNNPEDMDAFIAQAKELAAQLGEDVTFVGDDIHYLSTASALKNAEKAGNAVTVCVLLMAGIIITLLVVWSMMERTREMGILLAMGESRKRLALQLLAELLLPIGAGLLVSVLLGTVACEPLGRLMMGGAASAGEFAGMLSAKTILALAASGVCFTLVPMTAELLLLLRLQPGRLLRTG